MDEQYVDVEVWVMVDEAGDYVVRGDEDDAREAFEDTIGCSGAVRKVKAVLRIKKPVTVEVKATVPDERGEVVVV